MIKLGNRGESTIILLKWMLNLSVKMTAKMRRKIFLTMGTQNVFFWFRVKYKKKIPLVATWTVHDVFMMLHKKILTFWVDMLYFLILIVLTFWSFHWSLYKMLILLRNSAFFPVKTFILFTWVFDIILLSKRFLRKKIILGLEDPFQKLVSDIWPVYPTRFTLHRTSWQTGK